MLGIFRRIARASVYLRNCLSPSLPPRCFVRKLAEFRETFEPFVSALAARLLVSLPPRIPLVDSLDDWQTTAWDDLLPATRQTLIKVMHRE
jgi:hypothetical protein